MNGWVYVISNENLDGWVKIGRSEDHPVKRTKQLQASSAAPGEYIVEYAVKLFEFAMFEQDVHGALRKKTLFDKEWFVITAFEAGNLINEMLEQSEYFIRDETFGQLIPPDEIADYSTICAECNLRIHESIPIFDHPDKRLKNRALCAHCWGKLN